MELLCTSIICYSGLRGPMAQTPMPVVYMDPHLKDIMRPVPSNLMAHYNIYLFISCESGEESNS